MKHAKISVLILFSFRHVLFPISALFSDFCTFFRFLHFFPIFVLFSASESSSAVVAVIPKNEEVDRIELRRNDDSARSALEKYKKNYNDKMSTLKVKKTKVKEEQTDLQNNLVKFNAFVKEKQLKVWHSTP